MTYKLTRSDRKTLSLQICRDGSLLVRAPRHTSLSEIDRFVATHDNWIRKKREMVEARQKNHLEKSNEEIATQIQQSYLLLVPRVEHLAALMGVKPTSIRITKAEHRFGSCSSQKHICFSYRLIEYPDNAIDYVIVHELAHILEMNHSSRFWTIVKQYCENYKDCRKLLSE